MAEALRLAPLPAGSTSVLLVFVNVALVECMPAAWRNAQ
jgi:hypothetical protein